MNSDFTKPPKTYTGPDDGISADAIREVRPPIRITRAHHTDLVCAAMNDTTGDTQRILDRMTEDPGFQIDEQPVEGVFYVDQSVSFMYPHEIGFIEAVLPPDVVYPDGLPAPVFDLAGICAVHDRLEDGLDLKDIRPRGDPIGVIPTIHFDVESHIDLDVITEKLRMSDTYGRIGRRDPMIVIDSCPEKLYRGDPHQLSPLYGGSRRSALMGPDPEQSDVPARKPKEPPSKLILNLLKRI